MPSYILQNIHSLPFDYKQIASFYEANKEKSFEKIPVSLYEWFDANMAAPLGAVFDLLQNDLNNIIFEHMNSRIQTILQKNGFLSHFGYSNLVDTYNSTISYQKMKPDDGRYFREYVSTEFLDRSELPTMSKGLHKKMMEVMLELFNNAQIHSGTENIYTCGQFFRNRHTIAFCIVDTGIGFKQQFINRFNRDDVSSVDVIRWAIIDKNTTKKNVSGGLGLAILREFIQRNKGKLQIISYDGFYETNGSGETTETFDKCFPGTIVNVEFRTDDMCNYSLTSEANKENLF
jgi:signal transduction histidine kinase